MLKRILPWLLVFALIVSCLTGCGESVKNSYKALSDVKNLTGEVAKNSNFVFEWDNENYCVVLRDATNGEIEWCSVPEEVYATGENRDSNLFSPITVSYLEPSTNLVKTIEGINELSNVSVEKIENGIKVFYEFDSVKICIPVVYTLEDDGIKVSVKSSEITEGSYELFQFSPLPYMVSSQNNDDVNNSWLFVPYGSGALMLTDSSTRNERSFSEDVYGNDFSITTEEKYNYDRNITMPVYAAKDNNKVIFAVIESGAEYAVLTAKAGNSELGYSNVSADFRFRGYNSTVVAYSGNSAKSIVRISDDCVDDTYSIRYHILTDENANFYAMSSIYRDYLEKTYKTAARKNASGVVLDFLGGANVEKFVFGVPITKMAVATGYSDVLDTVDDFNKKTGIDPAFILDGYGNNGIDFGKIAGGYSVNTSFGKQSDFEKISGMDNSYINFELLRFSESGNGFSTFWDASKNANKGAAYQYYYDVTTKVKKDKVDFRLLKRSLINKAFDKLIKYADKYSMKGISLSSIGSTVYSDYSENQYIAKGKTSGQMSECLYSVYSKGHNVATSYSNDYAAVVSNIITDAPINCGNLKSLDCSVPFYAMTFRKYANLYTEPLNMSDNKEKTLLDAAASGAGLMYTVCDNCDPDLKDTENGFLFAQSVYSDIISELQSDLEKCNSILAIDGHSEIKDFIVFSPSLTKTVFDGGTEIYCNYSDKDTDIEGVSIKAMSFAVITGR